MKGYTPVYSVEGKTSIEARNYIPHNGKSISGIIKQNEFADGFRLPTSEEWEYAAIGSEDYKYAGSNNIDEVGWDSYGTTNHVAQKKPNGYGLYDMSGNVSEWCWDSISYSYTSTSNWNVLRGGTFLDTSSYCDVGRTDSYMSYGNRLHHGFRIVHRFTPEEVITAQAQISAETQSSVAPSTPKPTPRQPTEEEMWAMLMGDDFAGTTSSGSSSNQKQQVSS